MPITKQLNKYYKFIDFVTLGYIGRGNHIDVTSAKNLSGKPKIELTIKNVYNTTLKIIIISHNIIHII